MNEHAEARAFNEQLDRLLGQAPGNANLEKEGALLAVAARLASLPELLPAPDARFERRVWTRLQEVQDQQGRGGRAWAWRRSLRPSALLGAAVALVLLLAILPGPRQALSNWMASFQVGNVQVVVAPEETIRPALAAQTQRFPNLAAAAATTGFDLLEPGYLPAGYEPYQVELVSLQEPERDQQPLYVEITYRPAGDESARNHAVLRQFRSEGPGSARVGQIEFQSESVRSAEDITLANGLPAILVQFEPAQGDDQLLMRQLIWEQQGLTIELWSQVLDLDEMQRIAESLR